MTHKIQIPEGTARRMRVRQALGDFCNECCQTRMTFQPWRGSFLATQICGDVALVPSVWHEQ